MAMMGGVFFGAWIAALAISWPVFWPYFVGIALSIVALAMIVGGELPSAKSIDKAVVFGRLFLAVPMAVFGAQHFVFWKGISAGVPAWIPWHVFWTFLVGTALIAAAVSIVLKRFDALAAALLGVMIFLFVLLIHIPDAITTHGDRFRVAVALRDTSFSAGAIAYAIAHALPSSRRTLHEVLLRLVRSVIGVVAVVFGVLHFRHPQNVPVIPLEKVLPAWMPGHVVLAVVTGAVLIVCGLGIFLKWHARALASWLGVYSVAVVLLVYLPLLIEKPSVGDGLNYFVDTMVFCGCALCLAEALPKEVLASDSVADRLAAAQGMDLPQRREA